MNTTANLDKQALSEMNKITQAVIDGEMRNSEAAAKLRELRKQLERKRAEARARTSQL